MLEERKRPRMTWARLTLLCEAVRRITRFHDGAPKGHFHGLGHMTEYKPVLTAGWMQPVPASKPIKPVTGGRYVWFTLTHSGLKIVKKLMATGLTYKHIEAANDEDLVSCRVGIEKLFRHPERVVARPAFTGEELLPPLDTDALREFVLTKKGDVISSRLRCCT